MESPSRLSSSDAPLLNESEKDTTFGITDDLYQRPRGQSQYLRRWTSRSVGLLLFAAYSVALLGLGSFWALHRPDPYGLVYTPAKDAVQYRKSTFDGRLNIKTPYTGKPTLEGDAAWSRLFTNYNLRFTADELQNLNRTALELRNGGGYYGQLSAYHHLHCLKVLRLILWHDEYNISIPVLRPHADHCINDIRQSLMCLPDLSVVTFDWVPGTRKPYPNFYTDQTCVDWDLLDGWASKRSFSVLDQKTLVHPELGISFPLVDGEIEVFEHSHPEGQHPPPIWPHESGQ